MCNTSNEQSVESFFGNVISTYTRAQAIEDGVLVDVGSTAQEAGFKWPVALTCRGLGRLRGLDRGRRSSTGLPG